MKGKKETLTQEKEALHEKLREQRNRLKEENNRLETIQAEVAACTSAVEEGKNEIIEILNSRATTKGKAQRFDAMMEQLDIRKAAVSQRILRLKTEEESLASEKSKAQSRYDSVTHTIASMNEECVRLLISGPHARWCPADARSRRSSCLSPTRSALFGWPSRSQDPHGRSPRRARE